MEDIFTFRGGGNTRAPVAGATYYSREPQAEYGHGSGRGRPEEPVNVEWAYQQALSSVQNSLASHNTLVREYEHVQKKAGANRAFDHATLPELEELNRYLDILPYDYNRFVRHRAGADDPAFINASIMKHEHVFKGRAEYDFPTFNYILTQGPLEATVAHFWEMVVLSRCSVIVMLTNEVERDRAGAEVPKCAPYFPKTLEEQQQHGEFIISLLEQEKLMKGLLKRTLTCENTRLGDIHEITHYQIINWPDNGVPPSTDALRRLQRLLAEEHGDPIYASFPTFDPQATEDVGPPIIHCSSGSGRSGVFALYDLCVRGLMTLEPELLRDAAFIRTAVAPRENLICLRKQRMGLVPNLNMYEFVLRALQQEFASQLKDYSAFSETSSYRESLR